jgi:hypothetical protein
MDDEYYTIDWYIAHKSCTFDSGYFSNSKYTRVSNGIEYLKQRCDMIDKINENIDVQVYSMLINEIKYPCVAIYGRPININFYYEYGCKKIVKFESYEEFYDYMYKHYTHLIKSHDIKIALKD